MSCLDQLSKTLLLSVLLLWVTGCVFENQKADPVQVPLEGASFTRVYEVLKSNCLDCHSETGSAKQAWSMNVVPTADRYPSCVEVKDQFLCTTYSELTGTEWPWVVAENPQASQPFVNACDRSQSYHIGTSIPEGLSDGDCGLFEQWILEGAEFN